MLRASIKYSEQVGRNLHLLPNNGEIKKGSINEELNQILKNIDALLKEANLQRENILKCSIFLKNMNDFNEINEIYANYFNEPFPARETVEVARLPKDVNIEISFMAAK